MAVPGKVITFFALLARLVLGLTFVTAALLKLRDPAAFADAIARYHLVSGQLPSLLAVFLPALELLTGTAVLLRRAQGGALALIGVTGLVFAAVLASAWWRGLDLACGCFGGGLTPDEQIPLAFLRALVLAGLAFVLLAYEQRRLRSPAPGFPQSI
jgi:putative oxidoreductase